MTNRIEVITTVFDSRATVRQKKFSDFLFSRKIKNIFLIDVYTIDKAFTKKELHQIGERISHPVTQSFKIHKKNKEIVNKTFDWAIEIGFLPGVTDNVSHTVKEIIEDFLKVQFKNGEDIFTSQITFVEGKLSEAEIKEIADSLYNPLIQRAYIKTSAQYQKDGGMDIVIPKVMLLKKPSVTTVDLEVTDGELEKIGKLGIVNSDGTRRGPLALNLVFMQTIQTYFRKLGRKPTDIELESLAQTWSEHCKHTIFADPIDEIQDGLFKHYIKRATEEIRKKRGNDDFCVSVFSDNSGAITFDEKYLITHKTETHNSPSALDPFGGAITGIGGVNRDALGFGLGAKPVANTYGFCFADPRKDTPLYKGPHCTQKMLSSSRIMDGVIAGVNAGGNQSGIPTPQGFVYFDERYRGKPLVFVGTVGLIPKTIQGKKSWIKKAQQGDFIVIIGGRVGKDGIHGATFSSESLDCSSPATAVQIGDPITQKKLTDALIKEVRDTLLYTSITDNGAGGLSCSVAEMAKESGGCIVDLEKVPLKYPGLEPWEIWISESQERMTLSVPPKNWETLADMFERRGVEATVIGKFTDSGSCVVKFHNKIILDLPLQFLHDGLPQRPMVTKEIVIPSEVEESLRSNADQPIHVEDFRNSDVKRSLHYGQDDKQDETYTKTLLNMLSRLNITSYSFITNQYDSIVQGGMVLPPLQGRGKINSETTVFRPVLSSPKGVVLSQGFYPAYSEIDSYAMAAACIDTAVRNIVAVGGAPNYIAILDNFCWCSSTEPERLYQLKEAVRACYDVATYYQTPFISGKDSMFNDFNGYDENGKSVKISIPPTLIISSISVMEDST
ncbi:MAG TPA: AIR synthase-related protein, partial [Candidatus Saccharimonadales bacterium]|nr:AIR synthase-related protein [Candidatus Saccharimonadales bacterium]